LVTSTATRLQEEYGIKPLTLKQTKDSIIFVQKREASLAILKNRLDTVSISKRPLWYDQFDQVMKQKIYDELAVKTGFERFQV